MISVRNRRRMSRLALQFSGLAVVTFFLFFAISVTQRPDWNFSWDELPSVSYYGKLNGFGNEFLLQIRCFLVIPPEITRKLQLHTLKLQCLYVKLILQESHSMTANLWITDHTKLHCVHLILSEIKTPDSLSHTNLQQVYFLGSNFSSSSTFFRSWYKCKENCHILKICLTVQLRNFHLTFNL